MRQALILAIGLGALLVGAPAGAQDNPACAKYQEPLAYNACLARFGPHAPGTKAVAAPGNSGVAREHARRNARWGHENWRGRRGRMRLEFAVAGKRRRR